MRRLIPILGAAATGFLLAVFMLVAAHIARPFAMNADDAVDAMAAALQATLDRKAVDGTKLLYVNSDLDFLLVPKLMKSHPAIRFYEWKQRPPDDGCRSADPDVLVMAPCARPDYVAASTLATPLWRTFLVRTGEFNGGCEFALVRWLGRWRIVSERCYVI